LPNWQGTDYIKYEGGVYSSEWFWAKILHIIRADIDVKKPGIYMDGALRLYDVSIE